MLTVPLLERCIQTISFQYLITLLLWSRPSLPETSFRTLSNFQNFNYYFVCIKLSPRKIEQNASEVAGELTPKPNHELRLMACFNNRRAKPAQKSSWVCLRVAALLGPVCTACTHVVHTMAWLCRHTGSVEGQAQKTNQEHKRLGKAAS